MRTVFQSPKEVYKNWPISRKIIAITAFASLISLTVLCSISVFREWNSFTNREAQKLETLARILSSNTVASLRFNDPDTANEYVESLQHDPDIQSVTIYDNQGNLFAQYSRNLDTETRKNPDFDGISWQGDVVLFARKVILNGKELGSLLIELSTASLKKEILSSILVSTTLLICGLAITILMVRRMQRTVTTPINQLASLSQSISEQQDYARRITKLNNDEVGSLVESFNKMLDTIQLRDQSLQDINKNLSSLVDERTQDLSRRNQELKEAIEASNAASAAKSDFLATMSHELRTPMTAIIGMASLLETADLNDEYREYAETINTSADILLLLINDLLDYTKIESGKLTLEGKPFEVLPALEESIKVTTSKSGKSHIPCFFHCSPDVPLRIFGDEVRFKQIVINLLSNALKFTECGHVALQATVRETEKGDRLCISINDTGIGIAQEKTEALFEKFTQADTSTTRKYGGSGLGLAIVKRLVNAMGGDIKVVSEPEEGSQFSFDIPIHSFPGANNQPAIGRLAEDNNHANETFTLHDFEHPQQIALTEAIQAWGLTPTNASDFLSIHNAVTDTPEHCLAIANQSNASAAAHKIFICRRAHRAQLIENGHVNLVTTPLLISNLRNCLSKLGKSISPPAKTPPPKPQASNAGETRVLLVEDNLINQKVFGHMISKEGYPIDSANNGEQALKLFTKGVYHVIFMDMHMPVMDGVECTKRIRADFPQDRQPWIIGYTANVQPAASELLREAGMNDILYKPVREAELRDALEAYFKAPKANKVNS